MGQDTSVAFAAAGLGPVADHRVSARAFGTPLAPDGNAFVALVQIRKSRPHVNATGAPVVGSDAIVGTGRSMLAAQSFGPSNPSDRHHLPCTNRDTTLVNAVPRHKLTSVVPNRDGPIHDRPSSRRANTDGARSRNAVPSTDMRRSMDTDADSRNSRRGKLAAGEAVRCRPRVAAGSRRGRRRKRQLVPTRRRRQLGHIRAFSWCCSHSIAGIEMTLVGMNRR